ncbi:hypothetical protein THOM_0571, partial [Trachipleistophora hominis]
VWFYWWTVRKDLNKYTATQFFLYKNFLFLMEKNDNKTKRALFQNGIIRHSILLNYFMYRSVTVINLTDKEFGVLSKFA